MLRHWSKVLEAVRPAVVQDVDIECLREFRSAARSVRALLLLAATSLPGADLDRYLDEFGWLADLAAPVREADVLLLEFGRGGRVARLDVGVDLLGRSRQAFLTASKSASASSSEHFERAHLVGGCGCRRRCRPSRNARDSA